MGSWLREHENRHRLGLDKQGTEYCRDGRFRLLVKADLSTPKGRFLVLCTPYGFISP